MLLRSFQKDNLFGSFLIFLLLFIYCYIKIITFYKGDNIQYGETNNWNALDGSRYSDQQNTRSSSTRVNSTGGRATYGTSSSSLSQVGTNKTRSARRKANRDTEGSSQESPRNNRRSRRNNKTPETIDITNSDSDDNDIGVEDNQIVEVNSSFFPFSCRFNQLFHFVNSFFFLNNLMLPCLSLFTLNF
jgi:hypothetical protein